MNQRRKQSIIAGGLTSSAGIFISKALGILYVTPFQAMATEANTAFYAYAYTVYDVMLHLSIAGIPFAIAALVAKYMVKNDYKTVILVRRLSTGILLSFGFIAMITLLIFATPITMLVLTNNVSPEAINKTRNVLIIVAMALFTVPLLSSFRGFYQGLKRFDLYAFSQVLEQFSRIVFLLGMGFLAIYVFGQDRIWAVYFAVASAAFSALIAIIHFVIIDRREYRFIKEASIKQEGEAVGVKQIVSELFFFAIPYLIVSFLNSGYNLTNLFLFNRTMFMISSDANYVQLLYSMIMFNSNKLTSIPQVLAPGFSIAIIPYISASLEQQDMKMVRKYILDVIDTVLYLGFPISYILLIFALPIYYVMYGGDNIILGAAVLSLSSMIGFFGAISPVITSTMMILRMRKQAIMVLTTGFIVKFATMIPLMLWLGYSGAILSTVLGSISIISINLVLIQKSYGVRYIYTVRKILFMVIGLLAMYITVNLFFWMKIDLTSYSRFVALIGLGIQVVITLGVYFATTYALGLPQQMYNMSLPALIKRVVTRR